MRRGGNCPNSLEVLAQLLAASSRVDTDDTHLAESVRVDGGVGEGIDGVVDEVVEGVVEGGEVRGEQDGGESQGEVRCRHGKAGAGYQGSSSGSRDGPGPSRGKSDPDPVHHLPPTKLHLITCLPDASSAATRQILSSFGTATIPPLTTPTSSSSSGEQTTTINLSHSFFRTGHETPASCYILRTSGGSPSSPGNSGGRDGRDGSRTIVNYSDLPDITADELAGVVDAFVEEINEEVGNGDGDDGDEGDDGDRDGGGCWWHFEVSEPKCFLA